MIFPIRKSLAGRRAVVIGSGPGGLSAAISLAVRGARVIVLEKSATVGAAFRSVQVGGSRFDQQVVPLIDPHVLVELFASADQRTTDFLTLTRSAPICRFAFKDGTHIDFHHEAEALQEEIARIDGQDARRILPYLRRCRMIGAGLEEAVRVLPLKGRGSLAGWRVSRVAGELLSPFSFRRAIRRTFRSEAVQSMMMSIRSLSGLAPAGPSGVQEAFLARLHEHGGWRIDGGTEALLEALLRLCELLGVKLMAKAAVERIELEGGRVRRVIGDGFKPLTASLVVSSGDSFDRLGRLLPKLEDLDPRLKKAWKLPRVAGRCQLLVEAGERWDNMVPRTIHVSDDVQEESRFVDRWKVASMLPSLYVESGGKDSAGQTTLSIRASVPPPTSRFAWSEEHNAAMQERMLSMLEERGLKGLKGAIRGVRMLSPLTPESDEAGLYGHAPGYAVTSLASCLRIPTNRVEEVPGLYLASGYTFPGPGFANELVSGMIAAVCASADAGSGD
jgi:diapolycopene oxygenase